MFKTPITPVSSNRKHPPVKGFHLLYVISEANRGQPRQRSSFLGSYLVARQGQVAHNALKTGLTGRTVLLPSDDVAAYQALEAGIYAIGRRELAAQFADEEDEAVRKAMIEAQIFLSYRRDLNNLSVQEARLRRLYEKDEAELKRLIAERKQAEKDRDERENRRWSIAIANYKAAKAEDLPFDPAEIGFEFSTEEIAARHDKQHMDAVIRGARYYEYKAKGYIKTPEKRKPPEPVEKANYGAQKARIRAPDRKRTRLLFGQVLMRNTFQQSPESRQLPDSF